MSFREVQLEVFEQPDVKWFLHIGGKNVFVVHHTTKPPNFFRRWMLERLLGFEVEIVTKESS